MAEFITELDNILETTHDIIRPGHVVMTLGPLVFEIGSTLCEDILKLEYRYKEIIYQELLYVHFGEIMKLDILVMLWV